MSNDLAGGFIAATQTPLPVAVPGTSTTASHAIARSLRDRRDDGVLAE